MAKYQLEKEEIESVESLLRGDAAAQEAGHPSSVIEALKSAVTAKGCAITMRGNPPLQPDEHNTLTQPKPPWIHAKSTNWDYLKGSIATRKLIGALGKKIIKDGATSIASTRLDDIPDAIAIPPPAKPLVESIPVHVTLNDLKSASHSILLQTDSEILLTANDDPHPEGEKIIFKVDLTQATTEGFALYCKTSPDSDFEPVEKLGMRNKDGALLPIGRDYDICTIEPRKAIVQGIGTKTGIPAISAEAFNTFTPGGRTSMIKGITAIDAKHAPTPTDIVQFGCATAFEGVIMNHINASHRAAHPEAGAPIQHGAEMHSPLKPEDLNNKILHIFTNKKNEVEIVLTKSEKQFAQLAMERGDSYYLEVHPKWNMAIWAKVVEKQLLTGYSVNADTLLNYLAYKNREDVPTDPAEQQHYIQKLFKESVVLNGLTFKPLERVYFSPLHDMRIWAPQVQQQLELAKSLSPEDRSAVLPRPQTLLMQYQQQFNIYNTHTNNHAPTIALLKANYVILEKEIVTAILKNEKSISKIFIHPEFDLKKWLPIFIKKLDLKLKGEAEPSIIDKAARDAFCQLFEKHAKEQLHYTDDKMAKLKSDLRSDLNLIRHLKALNSYQEKSLKSTKQVTAKTLREHFFNSGRTQLEIDKTGSKKIHIGDEARRAYGTKKEDSAMEKTKPKMGRR